MVSFCDALITRSSISLTLNLPLFFDYFNQYKMLNSSQFLSSSNEVVFSFFSFFDTLIIIFCCDATSSRVMRSKRICCFFLRKLGLKKILMILLIFNISQKWFILDHSKIFHEDFEDFILLILPFPFSTIAHRKLIFIIF